MPARKHHTERLAIVSTRVYSRAETAEILNVSMSTVKRLLTSGQLRASQPAGLRRVFITGQAILDMLARTEVDDQSSGFALDDSDDE
jgi:excisionase family DNA binding protein